MEHHVKQRSPEWYNLRRDMIVTASGVADAVGGGIGKPYDFLLSLFNDDKDSNENLHTQHGCEMEPVIHEAYDLLTGHNTRQSGFWTISDDENPLKDKIGASPDALVLDSMGRIIGLCEFKAPVFNMYDNIPRQHMIQMHTQMAVTGTTWCDFMAVCTNKKSVMLKRVHFCPQFWSFILRRLLTFIDAYLEIKCSDSKPSEVSGTKVNAIKQWMVTKAPLPYESKVQTVDLLTNAPGTGNFIGPSKFSFNYDLLVGSCYQPAFSEAMYKRELEKLDQLIMKEQNLA